MHFGQHVGEQPFAGDLDEFLAAVAFFECEEQAFVDLVPIERVDFFDGEQGVVVEQAGAVRFAETMRRGEVRRRTRACAVGMPRS